MTHGLPGVRVRGAEPFRLRHSTLLKVGVTIRVIPPEDSIT